MLRRVLGLLLVNALSGAAPVTGQTFDVSLPAGRLTVGDPVDIACTIHIPPRATLLDSAPRPLEELPPDVTLNRADTLRSSGDGFAGRLRLTLVRAGLQNLPVFFVRYRSAPESDRVDTVASRPLPIAILSVLPPGQHEPQDVGQLEPLGGPGRFPWLPIIAGSGVALALLAWHRRRPRPVATPEIPRPATVRAPDPYQLALARLAEVEAAGWPARGAVDRHYDLVSDALRRYLAEAAGIDALERTTSELVRLLPPALTAANGYRGLLDEADLVKFARARPDAARAAAYLGAVRSLLSRWHDVLGRSDALR